MLSVLIRLNECQCVRGVATEMFIVGWMQRLGLVEMLADAFEPLHLMTSWNLGGIGNIVKPILHRACCEPTFPRTRAQAQIPLRTHKVNKGLGRNLWHFPCSHLTQHQRRAPHRTRCNQLLIRSWPRIPHPVSETS